MSSTASAVSGAFFHVAFHQLILRGKKILRGPKQPIDLIEVPLRSAPSEVHPVKRDALRPCVTV